MPNLFSIYSPFIASLIMSYEFPTIPHSFLVDVPKMAFFSIDSHQGWEA